MKAAVMKMAWFISVEAFINNRWWKRQWKSSTGGQSEVIGGRDGSISGQTLLILFGTMLMSTGRGRMLRSRWWSEIADGSCKPCWCHLETRMVAEHQGQDGDWRLLIGDEDLGDGSIDGWRSKIVGSWELKDYCENWKMIVIDQELWLRRRPCWYCWMMETMMLGGWAGD